MSGEIIRLGDPTSHGGKVIEGSVGDICMGKPIAYVGHMTVCPRCKGSFPIVEGALTTSFYGKGVALAGMKTACGAALVATQFTDVVEYGYSAGSPLGHDTSSDISCSQALLGLTAYEASEPVKLFDLFFHVRDSTSDAVLSDTPYKITLEDGTVHHGVTDHLGHTQKVSSATAQKATIEVPYYDDSDAHSPSRPDACGC